LVPIPAAPHPEWVDTSQKVEVDDSFSTETPASPVTELQDNRESQCDGKENAECPVQKNGENVDPVTGSVGVKSVPVSSRRPVGKRWFYEPVSSNHVAGDPPAETKRKTKPPQRLTSSKLGQLSSRLQKPTILSTTTFDFPANGEGRSRNSKAHVLGASTNQSPGFVGICSLSSDLPGDAEPIGHPNSAMTFGESDLQNGSEEVQSDFPNPGMLQASPAALPGGSSAGDGERSNRFVILLTFPGGDLPDQSLHVSSSMSVPTSGRFLAELMGSRHGVSMFVAPTWDQLNHR
jgi:hypothetical protein